MNKKDMLDKNTEQDYSTLIHFCQVARQLLVERCSNILDLNLQFGRHRGRVHFSQGNAAGNHGRPKQLLYLAEVPLYGPFN